MTEYQPHRLSIAPMMDWTDRHCRFFHRQITRHALLYTEMLTAAAVIHGPRDRLLGFDATEHPVALQLGGSDPADLAQAARIGAGFGYGEINLNCGCPSDRVQSGCFGAVMMETPALVADCLRAMQDSTDIPVTVKCRIGVDDQKPVEALPAFLDAVSRAGVTRVIVHARKAWLQGLSPKENRDIPPLDYPLVLSMKRAFPHLHLSVNGGIASLDQAQALLGAGADGVMIGRAAYHEPWDVLSDADRRFFGGTAGPDPWQVADRMRPYIAAHLVRGGRLHQVTRHMLGLFHGRPGARHWRRALSEGAASPGAGLATLDAALTEVSRAAALSPSQAVTGQASPGRRR
jgi:tRNA-dihydrouridine synthase A